MATVPMVESVNYWGASVDLATAGTSSYALGTRFQLFAGQSGGDFNDLGSDGYLPDNRYGKVTALFAAVNCAPNATNATQGSDARWLYEFIKNCELELIVNSRRVIRGPLWAFAHPPIWIQGALPAGAVGEGLFTVQNGGYMLAFSPADIAPRQTIGVSVRVKRAITLQAASAHNLDVFVQTLDKVQL